MSDPLPPFSVIKKVKVCLHLWTKMALNVRMRDRSVKVLQYGCQMLIHYYGSQLQEATLKSLSLLRRASSSSRKAFWLLKSLNHLNSIVQMVEGGVLDADKSLPEKLDFIEHVFLVLYYWYESEIYFARADLFGLDEDVIDPWCNWTWFGGDMAYFLSCVLRLNTHIKARAKLANRILSASAYDGDTKDGDLCMVLPSNSEGLQEPLLTYSISQVKSDNLGLRESGISVLAGSDKEGRVGEKLSMLRALQLMDKETFDKQLALAISILELGVSLHYIDFYKYVFHCHISEAYVGAMGVGSSVLILYEGLLGYRRELR